MLPTCLMGQEDMSYVWADSIHPLVSYVVITMPGLSATGSGFSSEGMNLNEPLAFISVFPLGYQSLSP